MNKKPATKVQVFLLVFMVLLFIIAMGIIIFDNGKHFPTISGSLLIAIAVLSSEFFKWLNNRKTMQEAGISIPWYRQPVSFRLFAWIIVVVIELLLFFAYYRHVEIPDLIALSGVSVFLVLHIYSFVVGYQERKKQKEISHIEK